MLRDTRQHIRGKVLLDCASISGGARTETSTTIMIEGARERKAQDTLVLKPLSDINIPTSVLSFLSSQTGARIAAKNTVKTLDKQHVSTTALFRLLFFAKHAHKPKKYTLVNTSFLFF